MILQINEISENDMRKLVNDYSSNYYIGKSKNGLYSAIVRVNDTNKKILFDLISIMSKE